ncbi:hypothetical protein CRUP_026826 [Coryphaenoides rupestris]|nr:hypothetical protein CRUP_026826 [Coryphaenoides rupestris]
MQRSRTMDSSRLRAQSNSGRGDSEHNVDTTSSRYSCPEFHAGLLLQVPRYCHERLLIPRDPRAMQPPPPPAAALDAYCGSVFWNGSYLNSTEPDLPVCLEQTVLVWVPLGFLWLCSPWHLAALFRRPRRPCHVSRLYLSKQLVAGLLFITAVAGLALTLGEDYGPSGGAGNHAAVFYVNPVLYALSWVLVLLCQEGVRRREGAVDSSTLFLFWLLLVCCHIFPFQTLLREALTRNEVPDLPRFSLFYISFALELVALVLSSWADIPRDAEAAVHKNPEAGAPFLSRITFNWFNSMVLIGYKRPLVHEDMWELQESDTIHHIYHCFQAHMQVELDAARLRLHKKKKKKKKKTSDAATPDDDLLHRGLQNGISQDFLVMEMEGKNKNKRKEKPEETHPTSWLIPTIYKTFRGVLLKSAFFKLLQDLLTFASPQLVKVGLWLMIGFTQDPSAYAWHGYMYAVLLVLVAILQSLLLQQYDQHCFVLGTKALVVSNSSHKEATVGETVNLMSADAQRFYEVTKLIHLLWSCPLQIALSIAFLWLELGPSALAGLAVMVLMLPILKLYAWEPSFQSQVEGYRGQELQVMRKFAYLNSVAILIFSCVPTLVGPKRERGMMAEGLTGTDIDQGPGSRQNEQDSNRDVSLAAFAVFVGVSSDNMLTAEIAFTSISLFNILRIPMAMLPMLLATMVQTVVAKKRLEKFLGADDLDPDIVHHDSSFSESFFCPPDTSVSICDGTFTWERDADPLLRKITSHNCIEPRLTRSPWAVGSGKSSLISALLGEMHAVKGFVNMQSPSRIPEQIGSSKICNNPDGFINDIHLSSCLQGSVAYVPQLAWIQNATLRDNILFGSPHDSHRFQKVLDACALGPDLEQLAAGDLTEIGEKVGVQTSPSLLESTGINLSGGQKQRVSLARAAYSQSDIYLLDDPLSAVDSHVGKHLFQEVIGPQGLLKDKTRILVTHGVSFLPYVDEIVVLVDGVVSELGSYQSLRATGGAFSEFLDTYAKDENRRQAQPAADFGGEEEEEMEEEVKLEMEEEEEVELELEPEEEEEEVEVEVEEEEEEVEVALEVEEEVERQGSVRLRTSSSFLKTEGATDVKKGQRLIEKEGMETGQVKFSVYLQYLRAMGRGFSAMVVFMFIMQNVAFIGQNLWLSDWTNDAVDYYNMTYPASKRDTRIGVFAALAVVQGLFVFLGALLLANGSVSASRVLHSRLLHNILRVPMGFFDTTPTGRSFYMATSRQLRRLDSVSRSPIFSHFSETVSGLSVVRAYGHQQRFLQHNEANIDQNLQSVYPWIVSNRWLAIRLGFLGNMVVFFTALFAVISRDSLESGMVGLSLTYALNVTQILNWLVMMTSELETNIVAVERVSEYSELENEADWFSATPPPGTWPDAGRLQFEDYKVRYRAELDLVLNGITCDISSTEKVGIVGRTGAGKSSLTNCLMNLDPFENFSDEDIWRVLELSHLKEYVAGLEEGLQYQVSEGGENLSVGQRQLLCLGRALLRKSRILILDEATAAVDLEMDDLIQTTIRREFSHCTVLTIAHRLQSIMDSSRYWEGGAEGERRDGVMVLDAGKIVEFDSPENLLEKRGHFYSMTRDAGILTADVTVL